MGERDAKLQRKAIELNNANKAAGLFKVVLWSWDDIIERAQLYPEIKRALLIEDKYIPATILDPRRPQENLIHVPTAISQTAQGSARLSSDDADGAPTNNVLEAKIDVWREQIRAGDGKAVVVPLQKFIESLPQGSHPHVLFRALANLGAALDQAGQSERAAVEFEKAAAAEPGTAASHAYRAQAFLMRNQKPEAYEEAATALSLDATISLAAVILIAAAPESVSTGVLEGRLSAAIGHADVAASLSARYSDEQRHDDALRVARGIAVDKTAALPDVAISQAALRCFEGNLMARFGASLSPEDEALLSELETHSERAWAWAKERTDVRLWIHTAGNLVSAYRLRGRDEDADTLSLEAYRVAPDFAPIVERAVVAFMHRNDVQSARESAYKIPVTGAIREILLAADVAAWSGDWPKLQEYAMSAFHVAELDSDKAKAAELSLLAISKLETPDAALKKAADFRSHFQPNVGFEARVAELARKANDSVAVEDTRIRLSNFLVDSLNGPNMLKGSTLR